MSWQWWIFIAIVIIPTAISAIYYLAIASDQFETEFRFNLRHASSPITKGFGGALSSISGIDPSIVWDSNAVVQFIKSREMVDDLQNEINYRRIYSSPAADPIARLAPLAPSEEMTKYWHGMVDPFFDVTTGVISVNVRAFSPRESELVATTVQKLAEHAVNAMTARERADSLKYFMDEVSRTRQKLRDINEAIRKLRVKYQLIDPDRTAALIDAVQSRQEEQISKLEARYRAIQGTVGRRSPVLSDLKAQIDAMGVVVRTERSNAVNSASGKWVPMAAVIANYDSLIWEQALQEKSYSLALQALNSARIEFDRQQLYLNTFVHPITPEISTYPRRFRSILIVFGFTVLAWILVWLTVHAVRDHI